MNDQTPMTAPQRHGIDQRLAPDGGRDVRVHQEPLDLHHDTKSSTHQSHALPHLTTSTSTTSSHHSGSHGGSPAVEKNYNHLQRVKSEEKVPLEYDIHSTSCQEGVHIPLRRQLSRGESFTHEPVAHSPLSPSRSISSTPRGLSGRGTPLQEDRVQVQADAGGEGEGERCDGGCDGCQKKGKGNNKEW